MTGYEPNRAISSGCRWRPAPPSWFAAFPERSSLHSLSSFLASSESSSSSYHILLSWLTTFSATLVSRSEW
jgi:hypothetical protein